MLSAYSHLKTKNLDMPIPVPVSRQHTKSAIIAQSCSSQTMNFNMACSITPTTENVPIQDSEPAMLETWTAESPMNNIEVLHFVQIRGQEPYPNWAKSAEYGFSPSA